MPFDPNNGMSPDVIMNSHAIPTRTYMFLSVYTHLVLTHTLTRTVSQA